MSSTIKTFMLSIVETRISFGGWVSFNHLKTMDAIIGTNIHEEFTQYCQKHGCTLSTIEGITKAPWADFKTFLLGESPDD